MSAVAAHADEREAHIREVQRFGQSLPKGSYGRRNRQPSPPQTRVAARLRAVEYAYRMAIERGAVLNPSEQLLAVPSALLLAYFALDTGAAKSVLDVRAHWGAYLIAWPPFVMLVGFRLDGPQPGLN